MSTDRFHKAAKDGLLEVLKEATKRDANGRDEQGMTPTLYAAFFGHLEALRLLCSRGGDPDKSDHFGNSALHLAAAQGHKSVVTFLVNFGANIYAMDIDEHTPQKLAGINNRDDILWFLDGVAAKLEATDKKKAKALKEKAKKEADKKVKEFNKRQAKAEAQAQRYQKKAIGDYKPSVMNTLKMRIKSSSVSNLSAPPHSTVPRFSTMVSGGTVSSHKGLSGTVQRKIKSRYANTDDDFKISEIEDGKKSVRSIRGIRRDSEVMYERNLEAGKRDLKDVFTEPDFSTEMKQETTNLTRSKSQPDFVNELNNNDSVHHEQGSIFNRAGLGSLAFRKSINSTLQTFQMNDVLTEDSSIGSAGSLAFRQNQFPNNSFDDDLSDPESSEDESPYNALERFLTAWGLGEYTGRFEEQKIDLDTLMLLTESDIKSLNLPLGSYRKLVNAISERKTALENPGEVTDSQL